MATDKFFLIAGIITAVLVVLFTVIGVVMYVKRTGLFEPYSYTGKDAQGTRWGPNGFEQDNKKINPAVQGILKTKIGAWEATQPGSSPDSFGYYGQS